MCNFCTVRDKHALSRNLSRTHTQMTNDMYAYDNTFFFATFLHARIGGFLPLSRGCRCLALGDEGIGKYVEEILDLQRLRSLWHVMRICPERIAHSALFVASGLGKP